MKRLALLLALAAASCSTDPLPEPPRCTPGGGYCAGALLMACTASGEDAVPYLDCAARGLACGTKDCDSAATRALGLPGACCRPMSTAPGVDPDGSTGPR